jgi:hypothetical protein
MREKLYKVAIVLQVIFVGDGLLMTLSLREGGYATMSYAVQSFFPFFLPAILIFLVVTGVYGYGYTRLSWKPRKLEVVFFVIFVVTLVYKYFAFLRGEWGTPFDPA